MFLSSPEDITMFPLSLGQCLGHFSPADRQRGMMGETSTLISGLPFPDGGKKTLANT